MPADDSRDDPMLWHANIMTYTYDCEGKNVTITYSMPYGPTATCDHDPEKSPRGFPLARRFGRARPTWLHPQPPRSAGVGRPDVPGGGEPTRKESMKL